MFVVDVVVEGVCGLVVLGVFNCEVGVSSIGCFGVCISFVGIGGYVVVGKGVVL